jgi:lactate dehydrogenase-like 2-hydroxyacid dehydrogenase
MNLVIREILKIKGQLWGREMKFKKIVVLDRVILLEKQWEQLRGYGETVVEFSGINANEILKKLHEEMDADPKPMCWTQLAQEKVSIEELNRRIAGADAIITCWTNIPDEVLLANPQLKYVGFWTNLAGHRINLELAQQRQIFVSLIPDYGTDSVAELTFAGILAVSRKLIRTHKDTLQGKWPYELLKTGQYIPKVDEIPQRILRDKLLGIIGLGRIGKRVAEIALAFRMNVQYWSRNRHPKLEERGVKYSNLDELFSTSDIVTLHLSPYAPENIVNRDLIHRLKNGAIFVNTSAGMLVDQEALFEELQSNRIHAFLDVYEGIPPRKIIKNIDALDNVFTYRSGWYTQEAITYKGDYLLKSIENYLNGIPQAAAWDQSKEDEDIIELPCSKEHKGE